MLGWKKDKNTGCENCKVKKAEPQRRKDAEFIFIVVILSVAEGSYTAERPGTPDPSTSLRFAQDDGIRKTLRLCG
ncbi:MAG TPA: hypothetical protein ENJ11_10150 [Gammaproteobacteria bacterium]|nr:hypothetical protein [Gammaproteobacteria bacterium]